jgi:mannose-6-phosphate isomerase-like protein (cupin superfamily)
LEVRAMHPPSSPLSVAALSPEEKEAFHRDAEKRIQTFKYAKPTGSGRVKDAVHLAKGQILRLHVQIVKEGGENNLHYHTGSETIWMVVKGRSRFYGPGDSLLGEFGPMEGLIIPGGGRYWFEKVGDEELEIMQTVGYDRREGAQEQRINVEQHKDWMVEKHLQIYEPAK